MFYRPGIAGFPLLILLRLQSPRLKETMDSRKLESEKRRLQAWKDDPAHAGEHDSDIVNDEPELTLLQLIRMPYKEFLRQAPEDRERLPIRNRQNMPLPSKSDPRYEKIMARCRVEQQCWPDRIQPLDYYGDSEIAVANDISSSEPNIETQAIYKDPDGAYWSERSLRPIASTAITSIKGRLYTGDRFNPVRRWPVQLVPPRPSEQHVIINGQWQIEEPEPYIPPTFAPNPAVDSNYFLNRFNEQKEQEQNGPITHLGYKSVVDGTIIGASTDAPAPPKKPARYDSIAAIEKSRKDFAL